jgi:hypothetical protein
MGSSKGNPAGLRAGGVVGHGASAEKNGQGSQVG